METGQKTESDGDNSCMVWPSLGARTAVGKARQGKASLVLLFWLRIQDTVSGTALSGGLHITEVELSQHHDAISCAVLSDTVDIHLVQPYITSADWIAVSQLMTTKMESYMWLCGLCHHHLSDSDNSLCAACFVW